MTDVRACMNGCTKRETRCECRCHAYRGTHRPVCDVGDDTGCTSTHTETHVPVFTDGDAMLCRRCISRIRRQLAEIPDAYATLELVKLPGSVRDDSGVHGKRVDAPAPVRLEVIALSDPRNATSPVPVTYRRNWNGHRIESNGPDLPDVPGTLHTWSVAICQARGTSPASLDGTVVRSVEFLIRHLSWTVTQPDIERLQSAIKSVHKTLLRTIGEEPPKPIGGCPAVAADSPTGECGGTVWPAGSDGARCNRCRASWTGADLIRLRLIVEQEAQ